MHCLICIVNHIHPLLLKSRRTQLNLFDCFTINVYEHLLAADSIRGISRSQSVSRIVDALFCFIVRRYCSLVMFATTATTPTTTATTTATATAAVIRKMKLYFGMKLKVGVGSW
uniref:Uncharacterized protein n=1 Tax=Lygus hesperus TaxID=30085 RepID=A0A146LAK2_LYGHE